MFISAAEKALCISTHPRLGETQTTTESQLTIDHSTCDKVGLLVKRKLVHDISDDFKANAILLSLFSFVTIILAIAYSSA